MILDELIYGAAIIKKSGKNNPDILGLALDSREVKKGFLFAAIKGSAIDGHTFIPNAISQGARAVLCAELPEEKHDHVDYILVGDVQEALGQICSNFYDHPGRDLYIIGITGTNGKTSIATWLYELGESLGYPCALISTIQVVIREKVFPATHTTPDIISLYKNLSVMVEFGCQYVFMEVSSHALDQKRTAGLRFTGAVFTNLSRDHLDYHLDLSSYIKAKKKLFDGLDKDAFAIVNADDRNSSFMLQNTDARIVEYSNTTICNYQGKLIEQINQGMLISLNGFELWVPFIGSFILSNLTAVFSVSCELGWDREEILKGISLLSPVRGRFERLDLGDNITGIVDYAHTPDALKNVLEAIRDLCQPDQRIISVIGAGGDRDKGKRPEMAAIACKKSEIVILTSDNPRSEDPNSIIEDMKPGVPPHMDSQVFSLPNRREAIKLAFAMAKEGDYVLVAGKGHETYQEIKGIKHHFDDLEELMKIKSANYEN